MSLVKFAYRQLISNRVFLVFIIIWAIVCTSLTYYALIFFGNEHTAHFVRLHRRVNRASLNFAGDSFGNRQRLVSMKELDEKIIEPAKIIVNFSKSPKCNEFPFIAPKLKDLKESFDWQVVRPIDSSILLFSAYYDPRTKPQVIRVVGIIIKKIVEPLFCQLWYDGKHKPMIIEANRYELPELRGIKYTTAFYNCYLRRRSHPPYAVSLVKAPCESPSNMLKIINNHHSYNRPEVNFTVCITPLNFRFDNLDQTIEILEVNRMFGAERFVFYNYSVGPKVERFLKNAEERGERTVDVIPWNIPVSVDVWPPDPKVVPEIHYFGQVAALNDCLYRNMFRSRFIVFTDLDEVIVPRVTESWSAMLAQVTDDWQRRYFSLDESIKFPGSYNFMNVFFPLDWDDAVTNGSKQYRNGPIPMTIRKRYRDFKVYQHFVRSKHIAWSKVTVAVTVHMAHEFINDRKVGHVHVKQEHALLHHYRRCDDFLDVSKVDQIRDDTMLRFFNEINSRVDEMYRKLDRLVPGRNSSYA